MQSKDPADKQEFEIPSDRQEARNVFGQRKGSRHTEMDGLQQEEQCSFEQPSIFYDAPSFDQKLNPLESLLDNSQMLMLPKKTKTLRKTMTGASGPHGLVELTSSKDLYPADKRQSVAPRPSLLQGKKVRPQIPQLKMKLAAASIAQHSSASKPTAFMTERDTKDKIMELLKPSFGLWTIDQQIKAVQVSKAYLKNIKKHLKSSGGDAASLATIDLNVLNISQQEVEKKMQADAGQQAKTHRIKSKSRLISKEVDIELGKPNKQLQTIEVGRPKKRGPERDADSGSDGSEEEHNDEETMLILNEIEMVHEQITKQKKWIKDFESEKKRLWNKYDRAYDTLEVKQTPRDVQALNLKSIDADEVASLRTLSLKTATDDKQQLEVIHEDKDDFQSKQLKQLSDLVETSMNLQNEINGKLDTFRTQQRNRRLRTNLDKNIHVWSDEIKEQVFAKRKQAEQEYRENKKLEESKKTDDTLLDIDLDEVITGKIKMKKRKPRAKLDNFMI